MEINRRCDFATELARILAAGLVRYHRHASVVALGRPKQTIAPHELDLDTSTETVLSVCGVNGPRGQKGAIPPWT
jgi:hypothetical protein